MRRERCGERRRGDRPRRRQRPWKESEVRASCFFLQLMLGIVGLFPRISNARELFCGGRNMAERQFDSNIAGCQFSRLASTSHKKVAPNPVADVAASLPVLQPKFCWMTEGRAWFGEWRGRDEESSRRRVLILQIFLLLDTATTCTSVLHLTTT